MLQINRYLCTVTFMLLSFLIKYCTSKDTLTPNQPFKDGDLLVSSANSFALGFFSPGKSQNRYVGIWFYGISEPTVVWVANKDNPISGTNGSLSIESSGNLVLRDLSNNRLVWSTNVSGLAPDSYFVQLLNSGNLLLFQGLSQSSSSVTLWQSFVFPTNTLLPYMKDGVNRTSGHQWAITSWKSWDDPGTGDIQYRFDLSSSPPQIILFNNSEKIWRPGPWIGHYLSEIPDMSTSYVFTSSYTENDQEVSLLYGLPDPSVLSRVTVNESGFLEMVIWQNNQQAWVGFSFPNDTCDHYMHCGASSICNPNRSGEFECQCLPGYQPKVESEWNSRNATNGCTKKPGEQFCGNSSGANAVFLKMTLVKVPDTTNAIGNRALGLKECADLCLKNCSCTAYANDNVDNGGSGCITWYGDLRDMRQFSNTGQDFYIRVSASELPQSLKDSKGSNSKKVIIILIPSMVGVLVLVTSIWFALRKRKGHTQKHRKFLGSDTDPVLSYEVTPRKDEMDDIDEKGDIHIFDLGTIVSATNTFDFANKLGEGGFGSVFKGQLQNGREIAVKRLSSGSGQGTGEFKNETTLIARLQHRNLVKLLGCCVQQGEKMLVYEYLPNKGLDNYIFDKEKRTVLDWRKRFEIIIGIARGIVYLHRDSRLRIIHRDLKASNVLLDANMEPKISDFGMARIFGADQMEAKTHRVVGTYGYMSPEYAMQGLFSEKSDVFSYGVLLMEIISGKRNNSYFKENTVNLIGYVWELWKEGTALDIVDSAMEDSYNRDEVGRCILIGLLCVQEHASDRPTMSEVLSMLNNETSMSSITPKEPAFVTVNSSSYKSNYAPPYSSSASNAASVDVAEITVIHAR